MSAIGQAEILPHDIVKKLIGVFLLLLVIFAAVGSVVVIEFGFNRYHLAVWTWTPGLAALAAFRIMRLDFALIGWRWGSGKWFWIAYALPLAYGLIAYGILWGSGLGGLLNEQFIANIRDYLKLPDWPDTTTMIFGLFLFCTFGIPIRMAHTMGEEIGWRGLLAPQLMRLFSFPVTALITGLIWAIWHMPVIYHTTYNAGPTDLPLQIFYFTVMTIGMSFIATYIRLKTGGIWQSCIYHVAHNLFILSTFQPMTVQYENTWRYAYEFGLILPLVVLAFGLYFWRKAVKEGLNGPLNR